MLLGKEFEDIEVISILDWVRYIDQVGYVDYSKFLKLPSCLTNYVIAIRTADAIKQNYNELSSVKDKDVRKKLNNNIQQLEEFFR